MQWIKQPDKWLNVGVCFGTKDIDFKSENVMSTPLAKYVPSPSTYLHRFCDDFLSYGKFELNN